MDYTFTPPHTNQTFQANKLVSMKDLVIQDTHEKRALTMAFGSSFMKLSVSGTGKPSGVPTDAMSELYKPGYKSGLGFSSKLYITLPPAERNWLVSASEADTFVEDIRN